MTNKYRFPTMHPFVFDQTWCCVDWKVKPTLDWLRKAEDRHIDSWHVFVDADMWSSRFIERRFDFICVIDPWTTIAVQMTSISLDIFLNFVQHWFSPRGTTVDQRCRSISLFNHKNDETTGSLSLSPFFCHVDKVGNQTFYRRKSRRETRIDPRRPFTIHYNTFYNRIRQHVT